MAQSLAQIWIHIVFSTRDRFPFLKDHEVRTQMHAYLAAVFRQLQSPAAAVGGYVDHVHILCRLARTMTSADLIGEVKRESSGWIKSKGNVLSKFYWQKGYGAFSVSQSKVPSVKNYIRDQDRHHQKTSFKDEFRALLDKHEVVYDERYVWD